MQASNSPENWKIEKEDKITLSPQPNKDRLLDDPTMKLSKCLDAINEPSCGAIFFENYVEFFDDSKFNDEEKNKRSKILLSSLSSLLQKAIPGPSVSKVYYLRLNSHEIDMIIQHLQTMINKSNLPSNDWHYKALNWLENFSYTYYSPQVWWDIQNGLITCRTFDPFPYYYDQNPTYGRTTLTVYTICRAFLNFITDKDFYKGQNREKVARILQKRLDLSLFPPKGDLHKSLLEAVRLYKFNQKRILISSQNNLKISFH